MEIEQVQEYCQEALKIAKLEGTHASLSFLIGEKFGLNFSLLRKARRKLQFLYPSDDMSEDHPLNQGGRTLKMSYALTVQEHYSIPLEQVKHLESILAGFAEAILNAFSQEDIKNYLESSPGIGTDPKEMEDPESEAEFSVNDLLLEAEEILVLEDIKKLLLKDTSS
ncbi:MAG: hypothetical protein HN472_14465 [Nitrospina sp.]|jgi:hypothetical protein|nr:hypothetical protein [Nitrospina sp.]MBT3510738.1 hypothetical protein [Nitrospina sp.]MBT3876007.1 hypothetical protein [Nitrospina sp.]MBT4048950.1 hypothetical protein [Nitrospina sp.]MBT4557628.1 hypothetical protein [Nitrospina sp.]